MIMAAVVAACLNLVQSDFDAYRRWKIAYWDKPVVGGYLCGRSDRHTPLAWTTEAYFMGACPVERATDGYNIAPPPRSARFAKATKASSSL